MTGLPDFLTYENTGFTAEHWYQRPGSPTRYYTRKAAKDAIRRAARRGLTTDEPIGPHQPAMRIVRPETRFCAKCGESFIPGGGWGVQRSWCPGCKARHANAARRGKTA